MLLGTNVYNGCCLQFFIIPSVRRSGLPDPRPTTVNVALICVPPFKRVNYGNNHSFLNLSARDGPMPGSWRSSLSLSSRSTTAPTAKITQPASTPSRLCAKLAVRPPPMPAAVAAAPVPQLAAAAARARPAVSSAGRARASARRSRRWPWRYSSSTLSAAANECAATPAMAAPVMPCCGTSSRFRAALSSAAAKGAGPGRARSRGPAGAQQR